MARAEITMAFSFDEEVNMALYEMRVRILTRLDKEPKEFEVSEKIKQVFPNANVTLDHVLHAVQAHELSDEQFDAIMNAEYGGDETDE